MGQGIGGAEPAVGREHGQASGLQRRGDAARAVDQHGVGDARGEGVRVLIHPQHRHPVRRIFPDLRALEHLAHGLGERPTARDDHQAAPGPEGGDRLDGELERARLAEQSPADLEDGVHRRCDPLHAGNISATAAAGAWRAAGPSRSDKWIT